LEHQNEELVLIDSLCFLPAQVLNLNEVSLLLGLQGLVLDNDALLQDINDALARKLQLCVASLPLAHGHSLFCVYCS
jgi:hypothetical protein